MSPVETACTSASGYLIIFWKDLIRLITSDEHNVFLQAVNTTSSKHKRIGNWENLNVLKIVTIVLEIINA
jgi:hypothetical protein